MTGLDILLTASVSFIISFLAIPIVIQIAEAKKLYDIPDERKLHTKKIASLGGIGIFAGFIIASLLSIQGQLNPEFQYFFAAAFVIFFLGLKDDIVVLSASKKFISFFFLYQIGFSGDKTIIYSSLTFQKQCITSDDFFIFDQ